MLHPGASTLTPYSHQPSEGTARAIERENAHLAHNYHPLPVVAKKAKAQWVWDVDGKKYLDCLAAYSAPEASCCINSGVAGSVCRC